MSPLDRYALDRKRGRSLPLNEPNDKLLFVEEYLTGTDGGSQTRTGVVRLHSVRTLVSPFSKKVRVAEPPFDRPERMLRQLLAQAYFAGDCFSRCAIASIKCSFASRVRVRLCRFARAFRLERARLAALDPVILQLAPEFMGAEPIGQFAARRTYIPVGCRLILKLAFAV